jgi:hypothetical protein
MTTNQRQQRGLEVVMPELREEGRRAAMGAVRASAFYRGRREAEALGWLQWLAMTALVTRSKEGGFTTE